MRFRLSFALVALLLGTPAIAQAQYVIEGVVHDAATLQPLSGVAVFLVDDATGAVVSPGVLDDPAQQGRVTAEDGRYRFDVAQIGIVRLTIERPDAQLVFPSATRPPADGIACREVPCPNNQINESGTPTADGIHALRFDTNIAGGGLNNHLPVDRLDKLITATLGRRSPAHTPRGPRGVHGVLRHEAARADRGLRDRAVDPRGAAAAAGFRGRRAPLGHVHRRGGGDTAVGPRAARRAGRDGTERAAPATGRGARRPAAHADVGPGAGVVGASGRDHRLQRVRDLARDRR